MGAFDSVPSAQNQSNYLGPSQQTKWTPSVRDVVNLIQAQLQGPFRIYDHASRPALKKLDLATARDVQEISISFSVLHKGYGRTLNVGSIGDKLRYRRCDSIVVSFTDNQMEDRVIVLEEEIGTSFSASLVASWILEHIGPNLIYSTTH